MAPHEWAAIIGAVGGILNVFVMFILNDMRSRIMRVESNMMRRDRGDHEE